MGSPCVPRGFPLDSLAKTGFPLLMCIRVESMTSPIVLTWAKNAFLLTNELSSKLGKNGFLHTNKRRSSTMKTIRLPGLVR